MCNDPTTVASTLVQTLSKVWYRNREEERRQLFASDASGPRHGEFKIFNFLRRRPPPPARTPLAPEEYNANITHITRGRRNNDPITQPAPHSRRQRRYVPPIASPSPAAAAAANVTHLRQQPRIGHQSPRWRRKQQQHETKATRGKRQKWTFGRRNRFGIAEFGGGENVIDGGGDGEADLV